MIFCTWLAAASMLASPQIEIQKVSGGASNHNYYAKIDSHDLFVRVGEQVKNEWKNGKIAAELGFSPDILYYNPDLHIVILPFIDGEIKKIDWDYPETVEEIVLLLKSLHQSRAKFESSFSPIDSIHEYYAQVQGKISLPQELEQKLLSHVEKLSQIPIRKDTPCHLDLHMGNLLFGKERVWLIDWEFAAMSDPLFDLATFVSSEEMTYEQSCKTLAFYLNREASVKEQNYFNQMRFLADVRWALWCYSQMLHSTIDWDYEGNAKRFIQSAQSYVWYYISDIQLESNQQLE